MAYIIGWRELTYCWLSGCTARRGYVLRCGALRGFALAYHWHGVASRGGTRYIVPREELGRYYRGEATQHNAMTLKTMTSHTTQSHET